MTKRISKSDAEKAIKDADALEVLFEEIDRSDNTSSKQTALNSFINEVKKQINDQRNVKLYSVKVK